MTPPRKISRSLVLCCAAVYLLGILFMFLQVRRHTDGHFVYALDDAYIHLALAEQVAHGHYGINPTEPSSPSSSILWPLLLTPFASFAWHSYLPLILNILFGIVASCLIAMAVDSSLLSSDENSRTAWWQKLVLAVLLMIVANLFSLTIVGMEHVLQVMLSIACAIGMMEALESNEIPTWCLIAAAIGPIVRYENILLMLAVCAALVVRRRFAKTMIVFGASLVPVVLFGCFLKSLGLAFLPTSVLVKGAAYVGHPGLMAHAILTLQTAIFLLMTQPIRWPMAILALLIVSAALTERDRTRRMFYAAAAIVPTLQLLVGHFGWFHRYEVYAVIFSSLIVVHLFSRRVHFGYVALGLVVVALPYLKATWQTAGTSTEIYRQQYQMGRFEDDFYKGSVAVNDLGLVSYRKPRGAYVLDVFGLASIEAARQTNKTAPWLDDIVGRHDVKLAMLYPEWFHIPAGWSPLAKMCLPSKPIIDAERCVVFYSTSIDQREQIHTELQQFGATLPPGVLFTMDPKPH